MNKKMLYPTLILVLVFGLVGTAALASAPPPAPASPEIPNASISGVVSTEFGVPIPGVTIQVTTGITTTTVTTDVYGSYMVPNLPDGTYTLTPSFSTYTFTPPSRVVTVPPDATDQNFVYYAPKNPQVFLPIIFHKLETTPALCESFSDDFSNPASGWHVGEDQDYRSEYLNGEYRVLVKTVDTFLAFAAPTCARQNYSVEVDAHWVNTSGASYGVLFGINENFDQFYDFELNSDYQEYALFRYDPSGWTEIVPITASGAIHGGNATNHLKATRNGSAITLEVNGTILGTWNDGNLVGDTYPGVIVTSYSDQTNADARFDNFKVTTLGGSALVPGQDIALQQAVSGMESQVPSFLIKELMARFH